MLFAEIGEALFGQHWHGEIARELGIADRTISRYAAGDMQPLAGVYTELAELAERRRAALDSLLPKLRWAADEA